MLTCATLRRKAILLLLLLLVVDKCILFSIFQDGAFIPDISRTAYKYEKLSLVSKLEEFGLAQHAIFAVVL